MSPWAGVPPAPTLSPSLWLHSLRALHPGGSSPVRKDPFPTDGVDMAFPM